MLARSYLFAPGNNEKLLGKVFHAGADAVVLDLEDSVPLKQKKQAREMVANALSRLLIDKQSVYVRLNAVSTNYWREDIAAVVTPCLCGVRLAKTESADDVKQVSEALGVEEGKAGILAGSLRIVPTIESARGVIAAFEIASAPRVEAISFGAADFIRDIGVTPDENETQTLYARSHLVTASRAAGIHPPIASVFTNLKDLEGLRRSTEQARSLGFFGRSCVHPAQVAVINEIFTPTTEEIEAAEAIVKAFGEAVSAGAGVATMPDGQFIDEPIVARARAILALAQATSSHW